MKAGAKNRQQPVDLIAAIVSVIQPHSYTVTGFFLCRRSCNLAENERRRKPALRAEAVEGAEDAERRGRAALRNGIIGGIKRILHRRSNLEFRPRPNWSRISLSTSCSVFFPFFSNYEVLVSFNTGIKLFNRTMCWVLSWNLNRNRSFVLKNKGHGAQMLLLVYYQ